MSKYSINDTTFSAIGNAIRGKEGTNEPILVSDFANRITNLSGGSNTESIYLTYSTYRKAMVANILKDYCSEDIEKIVSFVYFSIANAEENKCNTPRYIYCYQKDNNFPIFENQLISPEQNSTNYYRGKVLGFNSFYYTPSYSNYNLYLNQGRTTPLENGMGLIYNTKKNRFDIGWYYGGYWRINTNSYLDDTTYDSQGYIYLTQEV